MDEMSCLAFCAEFPLTRRAYDPGLAGHRSITSTAVYTALAPSGSRTFGGTDRPTTARRDARQSPAKAGREVGRLRFRETVFVR
jgi:hypothetical protein